MIYMNKMKVVRRAACQGSDSPKMYRNLQYTETRQYQAMTKRSRMGFAEKCIAVKVARTGCGEFRMLIRLFQEVRTVTVCSFRISRILCDD
jgi:hypothetical protein